MVSYLFRAGVILLTMTLIIGAIVPGLAAAALPSFPRVSIDPSVLFRAIVHGYVYDSHNAATLSNAVVSLVDMDTLAIVANNTTDSNGYYRFDVSNPGGQYRVYLFDDHRGTGSSNIFSLGAGNTSEANIEVTMYPGIITVTSSKGLLQADSADSATITATVTDVFGHPLSGYSVTFEAADGIGYFDAYGGSTTSAPKTLDAAGKATISYGWIGPEDAGEPTLIEVSWKYNDVDVKGSVTLHAAGGATPTPTPTQAPSTPTPAQALIETPTVAPSETASPTTEASSATPNTAGTGLFSAAVLLLLVGLLLPGMIRRRKP